jgi:hypothetical protein
MEWTRVDRDGLDGVKVWWCELVEADECQGWSWWSEEEQVVSGAGGGRRVMETMEAVLRARATGFVYKLECCFGGGFWFRNDIKKLPRHRCDCEVIDHMTTLGDLSRSSSIDLVELGN